MMPPNRYSQYENAFNRGNATSGEPICSGSTKFANPNRIGVAYSSSMIVPCMVNSWLYCSVDRNCWPGTASSVRISIAIAPPTMKKANAVTRYMIPICLWSVVRNSRRRYEPLTVSLAGNGRVAIGLGATAVTSEPPLDVLAWQIPLDTIPRYICGHVWAANRVRPRSGRYYGVLPQAEVGVGDRAARAGHLVDVYAGLGHGE